MSQKVFQEVFEEGGSAPESVFSEVGEMAPHTTPSKIQHNEAIQVKNLADFRILITLSSVIMLI